MVSSHAPAGENGVVLCSCTGAATKEQDHLCMPRRQRLRPVQACRRLLHEQRVLEEERNPLVPRGSHAGAWDYTEERLLTRTSGLR